MHRCQVKMRYDHETPEEHLIECGDVAIRKLGKVWICHYHFKTFADSPGMADGGENLLSATDSRGVRED
jgi:hypothetical protein